jgi:hypothetical protein
MIKLDDDQKAIVRVTKQLLQDLEDRSMSRPEFYSLVDEELKILSYSIPLNRLISLRTCLYELYSVIIHS